ncbi:sugar transferase [Prosthecobacter fusiformis]|nr:sugar transferase [Prosthecobacter fusiformis]
MSSASQPPSSSDRLFIGHPGPMTGNLLKKLEERRTWRLQETASPHLWVLVSILGDLIMAVAAGYGAYWLRFHSLKDFGNWDDLTLRQYTGHMTLGTLTLLLALGWQGIYDRNVLLRNRWIASKMAKAVLIWTLGFLALTLALKMQPAISRVYVALNGACALLLLLGWRIIFNAFLHRPRRIHTLQQRTLFVGWNEDAQRLWQTLSSDTAHAFDLIGWVDASGWREAPPPPSDIPLVGYLEDIHRVIARHEVDMIIVADLPRQHLVELANLCEREMIQFKLAPSVFRIFVSGLSLETIAGTPVLGVNRLPLDNTLNVLAKRALDIAGALVGLTLSAPLIAFFGFMVWWESGGPIFYHQRRWGMNGVPFDIIKIRSMKLDAEAGKGPQWCAADDPRRLKVGAFMRRWNIDEVPQFWNVLKGQMSLVGPRPERPELIAAFKHEIPHYNARHHAKPGMTGWAQVKGLRGDTDLAERIRCDLWYLENWSLMLDLQIMFLTFFKRDNAY